MTVSFGDSITAARAKVWVAEFFFKFFRNIACDIKIKLYFCVVNDIIQFNINH